MGIPHSDSGLDARPGRRLDCRAFVKLRSVILALTAALAPLSAVKAEDFDAFGSYFEWAESHGLVGVFAAPDTDLDGDGITNLMAYAFGIDPFSGSEAWDRLPELGFHGDPPEPVLAFVLPPRIPADISYVVDCLTEDGRRVTVARKTGATPWSGSARIFTRLLKNGSTEVTILPPLEAEIPAEGKPLRLKVEFAP